MYNNIKQKPNKLKGGNLNNTKKNSIYKKTTKLNHTKLKPTKLHSSKTKTYKMTGKNKDYTMLSNQKGN